MDMSCHGDHDTANKDEVNLVTLSFGNITGFKILRSVCHVYITYMLYIYYIYII